MASGNNITTGIESLSSGSNPTALQKITNDVEKKLDEMNIKTHSEENNIPCILQDSKKSLTVLQEVTNKVESKLKTTINRDNLKEDGEVYLLYSFDLVNSTKYKAMSNRWPSVFQSFYRLTAFSMEKKIKNICEWKYIGDEILFAKKIISEDDILEALSSVNEIKNYVLDEIEKKFSDVKGILNIKSVVWLTRAIEIPDDENIQLKEKSVILKKESSIDFLGKDIDCGFRLGKYVEHGKIVLGVKYCYCLMHYFKQRKTASITEEKSNAIKEIIEKNISLISYKNLKGIWNDNPYPIIWYHPNWEEPKEVFNYFDHLNSPLVQEFIKNHSNHELVKDFYKIDYIKDLIKYHQLEDETRKIIKIIGEQIEEHEKETQNSKGKYRDQNKSKAEVHCSVLIVTEDNKILIFKRPNSKKVESGKWDFGSGYLDGSSSWEQALSKFYLEKYNINLNLKDNLEIINSFWLEDECVAGVIFMTRISKEELDLRNESDKYSEYKLESLETLLNESSQHPDNYVPTFNQDLLKAEEKLKIRR